MAETRKNFIVQGSLLAAAGIICRIIGLLYKIPLLGIIGEDGMGVFNTAYSIYSIVLLISSYSLPMAVSKLLSARLGVKAFQNARFTFQISLAFGFVLGLLASCVMFFGAGFFVTTVMQMPEASLAIKALAPAVLIMGVLGVLRGFFQGHGNMVPTAVSQILEQILHVIISLLAAYFLFRKGLVADQAMGNYYASSYGAAGATIGTAAGALAALLFLIWLFVKLKPQFDRSCRRDRNGLTEDFGSVLSAIVKTALPILISATIYNLITVVDQALFAQYIGTDYRAVWGVYSAKYVVLYNVPVAIATALTSSTLPAVSAALARNERKAALQQAGRAIRFALIVALPCAAGLAVLGKPSMDFLFRSSDNTLAGTMMTIGSTALVFYSLSTLTNGILQGSGHFWLPIRNSALALAVHLPLLALSLWVFRGGILAVVINGCLFPLFVTVLNALELRRTLGYRQEWIRSAAIPLADSLLMALFVFLGYRLLRSAGLGNSFSLPIAVLAGIILYAFLLLITRAVSEKDLLSLPKGEKLAAFARRLKLL